MKNPLLSDPTVSDHFDALPEDARKALKVFTRWLYEYAREQAETAWRRSKAPMAVYWRAVAAWSYHITRSIRMN